MNIRIAGIVDDSIVDGPGFRLAVFTQGCPHDCPGCHNPDTHTFDGGKPDTTERIISQMLQNPLLDGVTLTGGDPFCQSAACAEIAEAAKKHGLNVWAYSGWTYEQLTEKAKTEPDVARLLNTTDILVDGPFILKQRTLELRFRGSKNQRLIDVPASLKSGQAVEAK
ncbi:MAG: anaerobic ribonucleoside-triphosphate reductase activating protein [Clostridia bacterium]|nr:anaerobic ribonucleoside-triphosphate reductase activating protein [Clostridia bacterium]